MLLSRQQQQQIHSSHPALVNESVVALRQTHQHNIEIGCKHYVANEIHHGTRIDHHKEQYYCMDADCQFIADTMSSTAVILDITTDTLLNQVKADLMIENLNIIEFIPNNGALFGVFFLIGLRTQLRRIISNSFYDLNVSSLLKCGLKCMKPFTSPAGFHNGKFIQVDNPLKVIERNLKKGMKNQFHTNTCLFRRFGCKVYLLYVLYYVELLVFQQFFVNCLFGDINDGSRKQHADVTNASKHKSAIFIREVFAKRLKSMNEINQEHAALMKQSRLRLKSKCESGDRNAIAESVKVTELAKERQQRKRKRDVEVGHSAMLAKR